MCKRFRWTYESAQEEALKYNTRSKFSDGSNSAYCYAQRHNILDEICSHMKPVVRWTLELVREEALKYNTRNEFRNGSNAYYYAWENKILDEICSHMKPVFNWTHDSVKEEAMKYTSITEFIKGSGGAHGYAKKHELLDEIYSHMIIKGNSTKRCIYVCKFPDNHCYVGLTYDMGSRKKHRNLYGKNDAVALYQKEKGLDYEYIQLTDYVDVSKAKELEGEYVEKFKSEGWVILNRTKTGGLGSVDKWTHNSAKEEALKYSVRSHFKNSCCGGYSYAKKKGILDNICSHMKPVVRWTSELVREEMLKYDTRNDFCEGSVGAYTYALKHKMLDEFFVKRARL